MAAPLDLEPLLQPDARLRLREGLELARHHERGQLWYVLRDPASGRSHRLSEVGYAFAGRLDGDRTLTEVCRVVRAELGERAPDDAAVTELIRILAYGGLLAGVSAPARRGWRARLDPLALRLPLFRPAATLDALAPLARHLLRPAAVLVWLIGVSIGAVTAFLHWDALVAESLDRVFTPQGWLWLALVLPAMKTIHSQ